MNKKSNIKITIRFYEELNDFLPQEKKKIRFEHFLNERTSVKDVVESLGVPHTEVDMIMVNSVSVNFNYIVNDGDDISVYPVWESIDISGIQKLRPEPLRNPKFVLDVHLGKLARLMRLCGIDTIYSNDYEDEKIIEISLEEERAILTRDLGILKNKKVMRGYFVRNIKPEEQLREIISRFDLEKSIVPFGRCSICNSKIEPVAKNKVENRLPQKVKEYQTDFSICRTCDKIYWKGTHYDKLLKIIFSSRS